MATTTTTTPGIIISFANTPQAGDDFFTSAQTGLTEDVLKLAYLDVMANDLGGAAKTLYSLDSGTEATKTLEQQALLTQDSVRAECLSTDCSANGAHIWITTDGKVGYDANTFSNAFKAQLNALSAGEFATDSFTDTTAPPERSNGPVTKTVTVNTLEPTTTWSLCAQPHHLGCPVGSFHS